MTWYTQVRPLREGFPPPQLLVWRTHEALVKVPGRADFTLTVNASTENAAAWR